MPTKTIYIAARKYTWQNEPQIVIDDSDMSDIHAGDHSSVVLYKILEVREIEVPEMPSRETLIGVEIEGLEAMRERVMTEAREKAAKITDRISSLLSLEHMEES